MTRNTPLKWLGWLVAATGLWFVLTTTAFPALAQMIFVFSPDHGVADVNAAGMDIIRALTALFGATMIGWGITIVHVADHFTKTARKFLTIGVVAWFVCDSLGSWLNHLEYNVILNLAFLVLALAALLVPRVQAARLGPS